MFYLFSKIFLSACKSLFKALSSVNFSGNLILSLAIFFSNPSNKSILLKSQSSWSSGSFKPTENQWKLLSLLWLTADNITDMNQYLRLQTAVMSWDVEWVKNITWITIPKKQLEDSVQFLYWWMQPISEINNRVVEWPQLPSNP